MLRAHGAVDVGMFFGIYSRSAPDNSPARLDGREVIAVYEDAAAVKPSYLMWLEWMEQAGSAAFATTITSATSSTTRNWSWRRIPRLQARRPPTDGSCSPRLSDGESVLSARQGRAFVDR